MTTWRTALRLFAALTLVTGFVYPAAVTAAARLLFPARAAGSLLTSRGRIVGSALVGQATTDPGYFWPRPSAAGDGYDPTSSGASNLSPDNPAFVATVRKRIAAIARADGVDPSDVAPDAVLASGSGLDPHISPRYAEEQVDRVASARGLSAAAVRALVTDHTSGRQLGFLGEPTVNVLELNLALDDLATSAGRE